MSLFGVNIFVYMSFMTKAKKSTKKLATAKAVVAKPGGRTTRIGGVTVELAPPAVSPPDAAAIRKAVRAFYAARRV